jgi:hypothetical protein
MQNVQYLVLFSNFEQVEKMNKMQINRQINIYNVQIKQLFIIIEQLSKMNKNCLGRDNISTFNYRMGCFAIIACTFQNY